MDFATRMRKRITAISEGFMERLAQHSWPGNVRELQNCIERSVILSDGAVLTGPLPELTPTDGSKSTTLEQVERAHILQVLEQAAGVVGGTNGAAARLGMPRTTLITKMRRLGINHGRNSAQPMRPEVERIAISNYESRYPYFATGKT
jgi:formate hydrogenlyase transcriptional activator